MSGTVMNSRLASAGQMANQVVIPITGAGSRSGVWTVALAIASNPAILSVHCEAYCQYNIRWVGTIVEDERDDR